MSRSDTTVERALRVVEDEISSWREHRSAVAKKRWWFFLVPPPVWFGWCLLFGYGLGLEPETSMRLAAGIFALLSAVLVPVVWVNNIMEVSKVEAMVKHLEKSQALVERMRKSEP